MIRIRPLAESDSIADLTALLHRAYARLASMGLNYTAADQTAEITAKRIQGGSCFVAEVGAELVGRRGSGRQAATSRPRTRGRPSWLCRCRD